jgi:hypothetical protein
MINLNWTTHSTRGLRRLLSASRERVAVVAYYRITLDMIAPTIRGGGLNQAGAGCLSVQPEDGGRHALRPRPTFGHGASERTSTDRPQKHSSENAGQRI